MIAQPSSRFQEPPHRPGQKQLWRPGGDTGWAERHGQRDQYGKGAATAGLESSPRLADVQPAGGSFLAAQRAAILPREGLVVDVGLTPGDDTRERDAALETLASPGARRIMVVAGRCYATRRFVKECRNLNHRMPLTRLGHFLGGRSPLPSGHQRTKLEPEMAPAGKTP